MVQVAQGRLSKQIAGDLGISETTVNVHRSNLMHKMKATSIAELGRMADKLNLVPDKPADCTKPPLKRVSCRNAMIRPTRCFSQKRFQRPIRRAPFYGNLTRKVRCSFVLCSVS